MTIDELLTGLGIAQGTMLPSVCVAADANGDGSVTVEELIPAHRNAQLGCQ